MSLIEQTESLSAEERADLIARHIKPDPYRPGVARYIVRGHGTAIWAIVSLHDGGNNDIAYVADGYDLTEEQVRAALAFYADHAEEVDAFIHSRWPR